MSDAQRIPPYSVVQMANTDSAFYQTIGPFLSRREIVAETGAPLWDDDGKRWWIALSEDGDALGVVAIKGREACSFYVEPGSRGMSVGYALLRAALAATPPATKATATESGREMFARFGFVEAGRRGKYFAMRREIDA